MVTDYKKVLELVKKAVPELDYAVARGRGWAKMISDTGSIQAGSPASTSTPSPSSHRCCSW